MREKEKKSLYFFTVSNCAKKGERERYGPSSFWLSVLYIPRAMSDTASICKHTSTLSIIHNFNVLKVSRYRAPE